MSGNRPFVVIRTLDQAQQTTYGHVALSTVDGTQPSQPVLAGPSCERVAYNAGRGLCLDTLGTEMSVEVLDSKLGIVHDIRLAGIPSRARISPDGRWGGTTAFVVGHAYQAPGTFSTVATIIDMTTGKPIGDLENDFTVRRDGKVVDERDRNYWGLTFSADGDTFYATLATGGKTYLIKGSINARTAHTIHENVECPSLSPDETRIAYKKAVAHNPTRWRFHVLDLATGTETALAETRSVDDQLSWLDDEHLLYGDSDHNTWMVNADGSASPQLWLHGAESPTTSTRR